MKRAIEVKLVLKAHKVNKVHKVLPAKMASMAKMAKMASMAKTVKMVLTAKSTLRSPHLERKISYPSVIYFHSLSAKTQVKNIKEKSYLCK